MVENAEQIAGEIVGHLERAWNDGDGEAWGARFAADADFITVRGDYFRSRTDITQGHQAIFNTIYKGSVNRYELIHTRSIGDAAIVAHVRADLSVPGGPLAGDHHALFSMVVVRQEDGWQIVNFHNTFRGDEQFAQQYGLNRWQDHAGGRR